MKPSNLILISALFVATPSFGADYDGTAQRVNVVAPGAESAQHYGWGVVLRVDPLYEDGRAEARPAQECLSSSVPSTTHADTRAGGTAMGAVIGGVIGSLFGKGDARVATTAAGAVAGGAIGNHVAAANDARVASRFADVSAGANVRHCRELANAGRRIAGYDVEYRYGGEVYMARLPYDPGDRIRVKVSVVPAE